eukprot:361930-Prymnesium_polylepis.1
MRNCPPQCGPDAATAAVGHITAVGGMRFDRQVDPLPGRGRLDRAARHRLAGSKPVHAKDRI